MMKIKSPIIVKASKLYFYYSRLSVLCYLGLEF